LARFSGVRTLFYTVYASTGFWEIAVFFLHHV